MKKLLKYLFGKSECNHRFKPEDVCNTKIDPKCVKCGKSLSELSK